MGSESLYKISFATGNSPALRRCYAALVPEGMGDSERAPPRLDKLIWANLQDVGYGK